MRKVLKWLGIIVGVLLLIILIAGVVLYFVARNKLDKTYAYDAQALTLPTDDAALARGKHLVEAVSLCNECHDSDLGGKEFFGSPVIGSVDGANITTGRGGIADYTLEDWILVLRHGIDPENSKPLVGMPSHLFAHYSDADLASIIAYVQTVPPVDRELEGVRLSPIGHVMFAAGMFGDLPVERIDHDAASPTAPEIGVTAEYGEYLVTVANCTDCHGEDLNGGPKLGPPPGPDLTRSGDLSDWTETDFINTIRNGITPDGDKLDRDEMPWDHYTLMTDDELKAIWAYLQTLD